MNCRGPTQPVQTERGVETFKTLRRQANMTWIHHRGHKQPPAYTNTLLPRALGCSGVNRSAAQIFWSTGPDQTSSGVRGHRMTDKPSAIGSP